MASKNQTNMKVTLLPIVLPVCMEGNKSYAIGEEISRGCEETCVCSDEGKVTNCQPKCVSPKFRVGRNKDPYCSEQVVEGDECCAFLMCADSGTKIPHPVNYPITMRQTTTRFFF